MFEGDGHIYQNCYVVDDIDKAVDHWVRTIGAGPFFVQKDLTSAVRYYGQPSTVSASFALGQAGPVHIELIEVRSENANVYTDLFPKGGRGGFHHVGMLAKDFEAAVKAYEDAGYPAGMLGIFGQTPFAYIDTRESVGFFTEFHADTAEIRMLFDRIAQASIGWDGDRPVRPLSELLDWIEPVAER